jgi:hypothetical protein
VGSVREQLEGYTIQQVDEEFLRTCDGGSAVTQKDSDSGGGEETVEHNASDAFDGCDVR